MFGTRVTEEVINQILASATNTILVGRCKIM